MLLTAQTHPDQMPCSSRLNLKCITSVQESKVVNEVYVSNLQRYRETILFCNVLEDEEGRNLGGRQRRKVGWARVSFAAKEGAVKEVEYDM